MGLNCPTSFLERKFLSGFPPLLENRKQSCGAASAASPDALPARTTAVWQRKSILSESNRLQEIVRRYFLPLVLALMAIASVPPRLLRIIVDPVLLRRRDSGDGRTQYR